MPLVQVNKPSSLVRTNPVAQNPVDVPQLHVTDPGYSGIAVDTRYTPIASLMQHIAGSSWTVDYYSQVIDTDSSLGGQRPTSSAVYQQYKKIERLVMRVTSPLAQGQNPETKAMSYMGKAIVHSFIPNDGDMFLADIGDSQVATFRVMNTVKLAVFKEAAYEIDYEVGTTEEEFLADLENKTVQHLVYRADKLVHGESPIILRSLDALLDQAANITQVILTQYFSRFFNSEYRTLIVPEQAKSVYDPFLMNFMQHLLRSDDFHQMGNIRTLNVQDDGVYLHNNLWSAVLHQDEMLLKDGFTRAGLTETFRFEVNPFFSGIRFTGVPLVVYPKEPMVGIHGVTAQSIKELATDVITPSTGGNLELFEDPNTGALPSNTVRAGIYRVTFDDYYVLSHNFYDNLNARSTLEWLVRKHIRREAIDLQQLIEIAQAFTQWGLVEQFYYTPLVLAMLKAGRFES